MYLIDKIFFKNYIAFESSTLLAQQKIKYLTTGTQYSPPVRLKSKQPENFTQPYSTVYFHILFLWK